MSLSDFTDLNPTTIAVPTDEITHIWQPTVSGPISGQDLGKAAYYDWGKEWITVSPIPNRGQYADIQKAINRAVQSGGGGSIVLLNGTYSGLSLNCPASFPLEIEGSNKYGVVLKNTAGANCFNLLNYNTRFSLRNLTYVSQNVAAFSNFLASTYGASSAYQITLSDILFTLANTTATGDRFINVFSSMNELDKSKVTLFNIDGTGGNNLSQVVDYGLADFRSIRLTNLAPNKAAIGIIQNRDFNLDNAILNGCGGFGYFYGNRSINITNNVYRGTYGDWGNGVFMNVPSGNEVSIANNKLNITAQATNANLDFVGIYAVGLSSAHIVENKINFTSTCSGVAYGAVLIDTNDSLVRGNIIHIDNASAANSNYGILNTGDRNIISANHLNMTNNTTKDICIGLTAGSSGNQGSDNIFYLSGHPTSDAGSSNTVTGKTVA